jgi:hypothetical protein
VRALAPLSQEKAREAWDKAKAIAGVGKQPTAAHVREAVKGAKEWPKPNENGWERSTAIRAEPDPKCVLEASQRAVVAIRALEDLVSWNIHQTSNCAQAVRQIEMLEHQVKTGKPVPSSMDLVFCVRDAAADLGGLEELLAESEHSTLSYCAQIALAALKPVHDKLKIANMRVDRHAVTYALGGTELPQKSAASAPGRKPKVSLAGRAALHAAAKKRWARAKVRASQ